MVQTGVVGTLTRITSDLTNLLLFVAVLVALAIFVVSFWKGKTLASAISGALMALFFVWAVNNITNDDLHEQITTTIVPGDGQPGG